MGIGLDTQEGGRRALNPRPGSVTFICLQLRRLKNAFQDMFLNSRPFKLLFVLLLRDRIKLYADADPGQLCVRGLFGSPWKPIGFYLGGCK